MRGDLVAAGARKEAAGDHVGLHAIIGRLTSWQKVNKDAKWESKSKLKQLYAHIVLNYLSRGRKTKK